MDGGKTHARLHVRPPSRCTMSIVPPTPQPSPGRGRREVPVGPGTPGRPSPSKITSLSGIFSPLAAVPGQHAQPVSRPSYFAAAAAALCWLSHLIPFLQPLLSLPPWASGQSPEPWEREAPWPGCRKPFTRPLGRKRRKQGARTAFWESSVRPCLVLPRSPVSPPFPRRQRWSIARRATSVTRTKLTIPDRVDR